MADMLSNTIGIMLFILAFTILQTGGVLIPKRLPMERKIGERHPVYYVCWEQRLIPLDSTLAYKLSEGLSKPTYYNAKEWVDKFNRACIENEFFTILPEGEALFNRGTFENRVRLVLTALYKPKSDVGDTIDALNLGNSFFDKHLHDLQKSESFLYFMVYPDNIDLFRKAREYAKINYGFSCGWGPVSEGEPIRFNLSGGSGITPIDQ